MQISALAEGRSCGSNFDDFGRFLEALGSSWEVLGCSWGALGLALSLSLSLSLRSRSRSGFRSLPVFVIFPKTRKRSDEKEETA